MHQKFVATLEVSSHGAEVMRRITAALARRAGTVPGETPSFSMRQIDGCEVTAMLAAPIEAHEDVRLATSVLVLAPSSPQAWPDLDGTASGLGALEAALAKCPPGGIGIRVVHFTERGRGWQEVQVVAGEGPNDTPAANVASDEIIAALHDVSEIVDEALGREWLRLAGGLPPWRRYDDPGELEQVIDDPDRRVPVLVMPAPRVTTGQEWHRSTANGLRMSLGCDVHLALVAAQLMTAFGPHPRLHVVPGEVLVFAATYRSAEGERLRRPVTAAGAWMGAYDLVQADKAELGDHWREQTLVMVRSLHRGRMMQALKRAVTDLARAGHDPAAGQSLTELVEEYLARAGQVWNMLEGGEAWAEASAEEDNAAEAVYRLLMLASFIARSMPAAELPAGGVAAMEEGQAREVLTEVLVHEDLAVQDIVAAEAWVGPTWTAAAGRVAPLMETLQALTLARHELQELQDQLDDALTQASPARATPPTALLPPEQDSGRPVMLSRRRRRQGEDSDAEPDSDVIDLAGPEEVGGLDVAKFVVDPATLPEFPDVATAVAWARQRCTVLHFDAACARSAALCQYHLPRRAAADILTLDALVAAWQAGTVSGSFTRAAGLVFGGNYRSGVSKTALARYGEDYQREVDGKVVFLGPHVSRKGRGRGTWRLYWWVAGDERAVHVGWAGPKLRDLTYSSVS